MNLFETFFEEFGGATTGIGFGVIVSLIGLLLGVFILMLVFIGGLDLLFGQVFHAQLPLHVIVEFAAIATAAYALTRI